MSQPRPFPHTRAQLSAIARQYRPQDGPDPDTDFDDTSRVSSAFVERVVQLLVDEQEDELKMVLKHTYGLDDDTVEQCVLDIMHKHRDDQAGSSRNSSRLPSSAPSSPLAQVFRRPHTPVTSPLAPATSSSYMTAKNDYSPHSSPVLAQVHVPQYTASLPSLLNAKATEFKPVPRPLSAASSNPGVLLRAETPSPDMWAHSPLRGSNLAIAAPLIPERSLTPSSSLRSSIYVPGDHEDDDDDDDDDDPPCPAAFHSLSVSDYDARWSNESNSSRSPESLDNLPSHFSNPYTDSSEPPQPAMLTEGMTPFDVLSSSELEDALAANGYDFERAMAWLVDRAVPAPPQPSPQLRIQQMGGRITVTAALPPRYVNGRPSQGGNRVCRYFVAGECLRADCRFSHDLERALCRFWLRGTCAKQDNCEFLHHLPKDVDMSSLSAAMSRANVPPGTGPLAMHTAPPPDDFPALGMDGGKSRRGGYGYNDPGRTRFSAAVKKTVPLTAAQLTDPTLIARREAMGHSADNLYHRSAIVAAAGVAAPESCVRPRCCPRCRRARRSTACTCRTARARCSSARRGMRACRGRRTRGGAGTGRRRSGLVLVRERAKLAEQAVRSRDAGWSDDPGDRASRGRSCGGGLGHGLHSNEATEVLEEFLLALEQEHFYGLAYVVVGEEKHTGTQDVARGASRARLATGVREWVHRWGYPWSERDGIICVDALTHASE
ncbi:hypothetical protein C8J57DRAFT_1433618 [Mycena rebaudengoi]|nr:hypothetical protein C8J57DRAFT_1433618 [Mycena rebaudengoi]